MTVPPDLDETTRQRIVDAVSEERLIDLLTAAIAVRSPTGHERPMAELVARTLDADGVRVRLQEVEDGRANAVGILEGRGTGPSLMFNGHLDTSYSGDEPWLTGIGFQPEATIEEGRVYGLGAANMKGAVCCYIEAVRSLCDAGVELEGDVIVAGVAGEIEKAQWPGDDRFVGKEYRGYSCGSQFLVTHGGVADLCIIGEPTEHRIVVAHYGTCWVRISTSGPFVHTAFSAGRRDENAIVRIKAVLDAILEWAPEWESRTTYMDEAGVVSLSALSAGFPWRLSRTPARADLFLDVRIPPPMPVSEARAAVRGLVSDLRSRFPDFGIDWEVYVTMPGAEIDPEHPLVGAVEEAHSRVFGEPAEHGSVRWGSDASVLTRYGIPTVNYGPASGLPGAKGENVAIDELVSLARVYALTAAAVCGVHRGA